jgi:WD40 repeat protein/tetratricopeptide (TPR) repeat protein
MVFYAQFSPDGKRLLTVSRDNSARVWDPDTGQPITPPLRHDPALVHPGEFLGPTRPLFARFSPDGTRVVTASVDHTARVWDAATGRAVTPPLPHSTEVSCAQLTPDGKQVVTGCKDGKLQFWDATTGEQAGPRFRHDDEVNTIEFSPNGEWMVTASEDRTAQVWETRTGRPVGQRLRHSGQVRTGCFSPDGRKVVTTSRDYTARLWHAATGELAAPPLQHNGVVNSAQFSPDGLWVVTSSFDKTARVWEVQTGQLVGAPLQHRGTVRSAQFSPDGLRVVTASEDHTARVWEARTGQALTEAMRHNDRIWWAEFAPDGCHVATASLDKSVRIWDVRLRQPLSSHQMGTSVVAMEWSPDGQRLLCAVGTEAWSCQVPGGYLQRQWGFSSAPKPLRSAHYSSDGQRVVIASEDGSAQILDAETAVVLVPNLRHEGIVNQARFSPDGKWVATISADAARIWDAHTGQAHLGPLRHADVIHAFEFSPDGRQVVTASADKEARIWSVSTGKLMAPPLVHSNAVTLASFSRDGQRILTVSQDNRVRFWDARTGTPFGQPLTHDSLINSARFSPDGRLVVTASRDNTGRVWDGQTGQPVTDALVHEGVVVAADFTPDGQKVFTASEDGTIRLWDARTGLPRSGSFKQKKGIRCAQISPDGRWLAFGCADWTLSVVELVSAPSSVPGWLPELAEAVAAYRLNRQRAFESVAVGELLSWKGRVDEASPADPCLAWAKWFLADPVHRTIFPSSTMLTESLLGQRTDKAWFDALERISPLEEALQITPNDGWIHAQLARLIAQYGPTNGPSRLARVEWFSRRAIELMPQDAIAWWARAVYFECLGDQEAAVAAMERASQFGSNNVYFWRAKANLLEKVGRIDSARDAFTQLNRVAEKEWGLYSYAPVLRERAAFLERHGWLTEARDDRLRAQGVNPRHPQTPARLIDLWPVYNAGLDEVLAWQMDEFTLGPVPRGRQQLAGVEFDLRGLVRLANASSRDQPQRFPRQADGIPIRQLCHRLHFLHGADTSEAEGVQIGSYIVHCSDGKQLSIPIIYGRDVVAWNLDPPRTNSPPLPAWKGRNRRYAPVQFFKSTWENPRPDVIIETIDFLSHNAKAAPFLVAITAEP